MNNARVTTARRALASMVSFGIAVALWVAFTADREQGPAGERFVLWVLTATPAVAAAGIWIRRVGFQLLARGLWWTGLLSSCLIATIPEPDVAHFGARIGLLAAAALLAAGSTGLEPAGRFQPIAFRGTLLLSLTLAIADTGGLGLFGAARLIARGSPGALLLVVPMVVGAIGLLRMRTWGLLVSLAANVLVVSLVSSGVVDLPPPLRWLYVATAIAQLLVPVPMLITIVRRRPPGTSDWRRAKQIGRTVAVLALAGTGVYLAWFHAPLFL
jgi:hypothetical protein